MKKSIMIIAPQLLPIPDVGGGAIEMLITNLINENEKNGKAKLIIISKYDPKAAAYKYSNAKIYYFDKDQLVNEKIPFLSLKFFLLRISTKLKRIAQNIGLIIKNWNDDIVYLDVFHFQCLQIAKREKVDILINEGAGIVDEYKAFNKLLGSQNVYYHLHSVIPEDIKFRKIINNSISISNYVKNEWVVNKGIEGKNFVLYNGIDLKRFSSGISDYEKHQIRSELCIEDTDILVLFCGRFIPEKGLSQLLDSFDLLKGNEKYKLLVIGNVAFANNEITDFSKNIVEKIKEMCSVIHLGYVPNYKIPKYYAVSDIMTIPSVWQEGAGLVAIEGMASGLPLIVTDSGGMVEYVNDDCAIKVPINDELSVNLKNEIIKLSEDKDKMKSMGEAGKKRATLFSKENYYNNFVNLFDA